MTGFVCTRCGRCCVSLGRHISLERSISSSSHYLREKISGSIIPVQVSAEYRDLFLSRSSPAYDKDWCPFLRRCTDNAFVCTIYQSRPELCRRFRCCTMRIYGRDGDTAGEVKGRRDLVTQDTALRRVWDEMLAPVSSLPDKDFFRKCREFLEKAGYKVELFD